ncbi:MAG: hypothetical protein L6Q53_09415 [Candidatus Brocadia sinica]|nr:hypothetical protein [Candidatus Brocadia sinica]NUO04678.1 hypothetical protein [Candidatus Brocadia sinica]
MKDPGSFLITTENGLESLENAECSVSDEGDPIATGQQKEMKMITKVSLKVKVRMVYENVMLLK